MFDYKSETMTTSHFALVVLASVLFCVGNTVGQDEKKAESDAAVVRFENTLAKAKDGDATAMYNLGVMYADGKGVIEDHKEAVKWYRKAAMQGHAGPCRGAVVARHDVP